MSGDSLETSVDKLLTYIFGRENMPKIDDLDTEEAIAEAMKVLSTCHVHNVLWKARDDYFKSQTLKEGDRVQFRRPDGEWISGKIIHQEIMEEELNCIDLGYSEVWVHADYLRLECRKPVRSRED